MNTQAPPKAMVQFPPLTRDGGLQLPPSWGMSPREKHELGPKRSRPELRCQAGLVSSPRAGRSQDSAAPPTTKETLCPSPTGTPKEP